MSAALSLPPHPSTQAIPPARFLAIPVLACDWCGDDLLAVHAPLICVPCQRRANRRRRWAAAVATRKQARASQP